MGKIYQVGEGLQMQDGVFRKFVVIPTVREGQTYSLDQLTDVDMQDGSNGLSELWKHIQKGFALSVCESKFDMNRVPQICQILDECSSEIQVTLNNIANKLKDELNQVASEARDPYKPEFLNVHIDGFKDGKLSGELYVSRALPVNEEDMQRLSNSSSPVAQDVYDENTIEFEDEQ